MDSQRVVEEPVISKEQRQKEKQKEFRENIVNNGVALSIVKFLLSIKNSEQLPENLLEYLKDFYGLEQDESQKDEQDLKDKNQAIQEENIQLEEKIEQLKQEIEQKKIQKQEQEEQRLAEEEAKNKKGSKKK